MRAPFASFAAVLLALSVSAATEGRQSGGRSRSAMGRHAVSPSVARALMDAIAEVESDGGATSRNVYQLTPEYVADVNRIQRKESRVDGVPRRAWSCCDVEDRSRSEAMMAVFWRYYSRRLPNGGTVEELAKIHHVGHRGMRTRRAAAEAYWRKVRRRMDAGSPLPSE